MTIETKGCRVPADLVIGNPQRHCIGSGICKITIQNKAGDCCAFCEKRAIPAMVYWLEHVNQIQIHLLRPDIPLYVWSRQFQQGTIMLPASPQLDEELLEALTINAWVYIPPGAYAWHQATMELIILDFPLRIRIPAPPQDSSSVIDKPME